ncbi:winged helix-turn-helix domain-containing protein [Pseudomonas yamanorum]|uniref:winged helix-turn-helix domain-containing protein n=1 Tax=Pseudomonas yamanorum TaxID=515393 RepID=UPI003F756B7D
MSDRDERPIVCHLGGAEIRVLYKLISSPGEILSKEQLISFGWPGRVVTVGSLTQAIFNVRSFFGVDGHSVIVTSPKAGYMFNTDYLASPLDGDEQPLKDVNELIDSTSLFSSANEGFIEPVIKGFKRKTIIAFAYKLLGVLVIIVALTYFFQPEIEILTDDPLQVKSFKVGGLDIEFITSVKKDVAATLVSQLKNIPVNLHGRIMIRVQDERYRVVCYTPVGSSSYAVPINVPLHFLVVRCISSAGGMAGGN